jgi:cytochrome b involved in lipid metabolism
MHPGGAYAISKYCGLNATTAFGNKGGIGKTHTAAAQTMLGGFLIGTLSGTAPAATPVNLAPSSVYNTANIAAHNLSTDCWIIINSKVYSVAPYISLHPGGITKISNLCGKDATSGYNGEGHSSKAGLILGGLYIGTYSATAVATPTNGSCGTTNATAVATTPTTGLCTVGTVGTVSGTGPWTWSCAGTNGGTTASCSATKTGATATPVNGACGTSNGTAVASTPTTGLCTTGTSGTVSGTGPFTWSCTGTNGGTTASCTATLSSTPVTTVVNGSCGTSAGQTLSTTPSTGLCTLGTGSSVTSSNTNGTYSWNCAGTGGGTTASCTAKKVVSGSCGNADGQTVTSVPSSATDLCSRGTGSSVITGSTQYTWSCSGLNGGSSNSCSATISVPINGVCGSSSGVTATAKPTTNLCTAGRTGTVSGTGPWTWACTGRNGGTSASCTTLP